MIRRSRWLPLSAIAALLLATACSSTRPASPPGGGGHQGGGGPIPVSFGLDAAHAASATVTGAGDTIAATGADGTVYTLTVPQGALDAPLKLTLTPLQDVTIQGKRAAWQVGVALKPGGTQFLEPVTLAVQLPQASGSSAAITLVTADGTRYVPQAAGTTGASFTAQLDHFSDYVVGPYTTSMLGDAIKALLANLASPATTEDVQSLVGLWVEAPSSTLSKLRDELDKQIAAEIANLTKQAQNNTTPTPGFVTGLANAGTQASSAGRATDASNLDQDTREAFAYLVGNIRAGLQAGGGFAALEALVSPLAAALGIAQAHPAVLVGGVANVESLAQTLVAGMVSDADYDCSHAYFTTGKNELLDAIGAVHLLAVTSPSAADLQTDATSCVPPVVTSVTVPPVTSAQAVSDYDTPVTDQYVNQPTAPITITAGQKTFQSTASGTDATATATATVDATGGNTVTLTVHGTAQASNPQLNHVAKATADAGGGCPGVTLHIYPVRGAYKVTWTWQVGPVTASPPSSVIAGASLQFENSSKPAGSITQHVMGASYAAGDPVTSTTFDGTTDICAALTAAVIPGSRESASASAGGTITVQVAADPNGTKR